MTQCFEAQNKILTQSLTSCAAGDKLAFKCIYEATYPQFFSILRNMVKDEEVVRDILQVAYVSIWKNASKFDPDRAKAFTWMLVIMRNRAIDVLRKNKRTPEHEMLDNEICDQGPRTERLAEANLLGVTLTKLLGALPADTAKSIRLHVLYGMTAAEIATLLHVSPNTVKSWIRRGLQHMRVDTPDELSGYFS